MRLLLDAHVSGKKVGSALRGDGHDVLAVTDNPSFERWSDEDLLQLAARERRIVVTHDVPDFSRLTAEWTRGRRRHAGCVLVAGFDHSEVGRLLRGLRRLLADRPSQREWTDKVAWLSPGSEPS